MAIHSGNRCLEFQEERTVAAETAAQLVTGEVSGPLDTRAWGVRQVCVFAYDCDQVLDGSSFSFYSCAQDGSIREWQYSATEGGRGACTETCAHILLGIVQRNEFKQRSNSAISAVRANSKYLVSTSNNKYEYCVSSQEDSASFSLATCWCGTGQQLPWYIHCLVIR